MKDTHCLRPTTTRLIVNRLEKGDSLNIYGMQGIGKTRLLEDIRNAEIGGTCVAMISFKGYQNSYEAFCRDVFDACELSGDVPANFSALVRRLQESGQRFFLLIDDFHYLLDNPEPDPGYNQQFIDGFNSIKNKSGVSLLAVTEKPVNTLTLFVGKKSKTSMLNLDPRELTELSDKEIEAELKRRPSFEGLSGLEFAILKSHLNEHVNGYELLEHYEFKMGGVSGNGLTVEILEGWAEAFKKSNRSSATRAVSHATRDIKKWTYVLNPLGPAINALRKAMSGPLAFGQQIIQTIKGMVTNKND